MLLFSSVVFSLADHFFSFGCFAVVYFFLSTLDVSVCVCEQSSDFSDISESAADYFSRSNRRGSIVSDLDDLSIPDLDAVSGCVLRAAVQHQWLMDCCDAWCRKITYSLTLVIDNGKKRRRATRLAEVVAVVQEHGLGKCNMNGKEVCDSCTCLSSLWRVNVQHLPQIINLDSNFQQEKGLTAWPYRLKSFCNTYLFVSFSWMKNVTSSTQILVGWVHCSSAFRSIDVSFVQILKDSVTVLFF